MLICTGNETQSYVFHLSVSLSDMWTSAVSATSARSQKAYIFYGLGLICVMPDKYAQCAIYSSCPEFYLFF